MLVMPPGMRTAGLQCEPDALARARLAQGGTLEEVSSQALLDLGGALTKNRQGHYVQCTATMGQSIGRPIFVEVMLHWQDLHRICPAWRPR